MKKKPLDIDSEFDAFEDFFDETKIKKTTNAKLLAEDPTWIEANKKGRDKRVNDPKWQEAIANGNKKKAQDPEWIKKQKEASKAKAQDPIYKEKISAILKERAQDPEWRKKMSEISIERSKDPAYIKKLSDAKKGKKMSETHYKNYRESRKAIFKPIVTPFGIFQSRKEAIEKTLLSKEQVGARLKKFPSEWYYISQEEYIILTGKEIE